VANRRLWIGSALAVVATVAGLQCGGCSDSTPAPKGPAAPGGPTTGPAAPPGGAEAYDAAKATATVTAKVTLKGTLPKRGPVPGLGSDEKCVAATKGVVVLAEDVVYGKAGELANVVVFASKGAERWKYATPAASVKLDQKGCMYVPHVSSLMVNQPIEIWISDPFMHNVHAMPKKGKEFNKQQQDNTVPPLKWAVTAAEMVKVKCEVHPWMSAFLCVFDHPFHAVTAADGTAKIALPPGDWSIKAWHEKYGESPEQSVTVGDKETKALEFTFEAK